MISVKFAMINIVKYWYFDFYVFANLLSTHKKSEPKIKNTKYQLKKNGENVMRWLELPT